MHILIIDDNTSSAKELREIILLYDRRVRRVTVLPSIQLATLFFQQAVRVDLIFCSVVIQDGMHVETFRGLPHLLPTFFCIANDTDLADAFEHSEVGYLIKPYDRQAIVDALRKHHRADVPFHSASTDYVDLITGILLQRQTLRLKQANQ